MTLKSDLPSMLGTFSVGSGFGHILTYLSLLGLL